MKFKIIAVLCGLFITGFAYAECPANLDKNEMMKCHKMEKSGGNYQKSHKGMAKESTMSPITGEDVRDIAPAAGTEEPESTPAE